MPSKAERETTVTYSEGDRKVYVFSTIPKHIRRLRAHRSATETRTMVDSEGDACFFEIPMDAYDPMRGFRAKRTLTDEQRAEMAARLRGVRAKL